MEHSNDKVLYARRCSISRSTKWLQVHLTIVMEIFSLKFDRLHLTFLGHKPQKDLTKQLFWGLQGQRAFFALLYIAFIPAFPLSLIASQLCEDIRLILQDILIGPNTNTTSNNAHNLGWIFIINTIEMVHYYWPNETLNYWLWLIFWFE